MFCYIHIPFCESKCKYCRFASIGGVNYDKVDMYISNLERDIHNFLYNSEKLNTIYFGGGTPSILQKKHFDNIFDILKNKFGFKNDIEITLESTPQNITKENLDIWKKIGINRLSIGIQSLNDKTLKTIGRTTKETILSSLDLLKNSSISNISVDFIIGLPYVKKGETILDIKYIIKKYDFIKHISVYMLEDYYDIEQEAKIFDKITYPDNWKELSINEEDYLLEYLEIKKYLENQGFNRYEISNYAKEGYECKHNKSYWNHSQVVGFGLGSHSYINNIRYSYKQSFKEYNNLELEYKDILNEEDIFIEKIMFGLRTNGLSKEIFDKFNKQKIDDFINDGYLKIQNNKLVLNDKYITIIDKIILELI